MKENFSEHDWDAIIIGSGIGGLILGALLAKQRRKRILVLEHHDKLGGFTHAFTRRRDFAFDIGVHYIGDLAPMSALRQLFDNLTDGRLQWDPLPEFFDRLFFGDFEWDIPSNRNEHLRRLKLEFPEEASGLDAYFTREALIADAYAKWQISECLPPVVRDFERWRLRFQFPELFETTSRVLERSFLNPRIRRILAARWMGFGSPPELSSFGMHCVHAIHYGDGAWYPVGGGQEIANQLCRPILAAGGELRVRTLVQRITLKDGQANGVEVLNLKTREIEAYKSPLIVSNVGARQTYLNLLPAQAKVKFRAELEASEIGSSVLSLFMGLRTSPQALGFHGSNYWLCPSGPGHVVDVGRGLQQPLWAFLSFPSAKNRKAEAPTAQVIVMCAGDFFEKWNGSAWRRRSEDYEACKSELSRWIIDEVENQFPGLKSQILFSELSTPLTVEHFHRSQGGAVYGVPSTPERLFMPWARSRTPIRGLYLTGSDTFCPGIAGSIHGALKTFDLVKDS